MNKLLIIIDPKHQNDLEYVRNTARENPGKEGSVKEISDRVWLIDVHMSLQTFSLIAESAFSRHVRLSVFEVLDELQ